MPLASWAWGGMSAAFVVVPATWAAWRVRRRFLGDWVGAPARLAESVIAIGLIIAVAQLLGAVGAFTPTGLVAASVMVGVGVAVAADRLTPSRAASEPVHVEQRRDAITSVATIAAVAIAVGRWSTFAAESLRGGVLDSDSIWYHLTRAARFAQTGWVTRLHFTAPEFPDTFHPANAELVQAIPMALFHRDLLAGLLNMGWLALLLLAAWCVGRPYGQAPRALLGAASLLAAPLFLSREAGNAGNDVVAVAFLVAAVALLLQPSGGEARICVAGAAAGLAVATKLTVVPLILVLTVGVVVVGEGRAKLRRAFAWLVPLVGCGGYWYVRNWVEVGSPVPATRLPLLPSPSFRIADEVGFSVADYVTNGSVWRHWFLPGLRADFGLAYPIVAALVVAAVAAAAATRVHRWGPTLAAALVVGSGVYVVLPTTALGERGSPVLFASNVAYLAPVLVLAVAILPTLWSSSPLIDLVVTGSFAAVLVLGSFSSPLALWERGSFAVGLVVTLVVLVVGALLRWSTTRAAVVWKSGSVIAVVVLALVVVSSGRSRATRYAEEPFYRWAVGVTDARVGVAGLGKQYPFYGYALDNWVQYIGVEGEHGEYHDIATCAAWRTQLRRSQVTYVVLRSERTRIDDRQLVWTRSDPAARVILRAQGGYVFAYDARVPDPGCD